MTNEIISGKYYVIDQENSAPEWWSEVRTPDHLGGAKWIRALGELLESGPVFISDDDLVELKKLDGWQSSAISEGPIMAYDLEENILDHSEAETIYESIFLSDYDDGERITDAHQEYELAGYLVHCTPDAARRWNDGTDFDDRDYLMLGISAKKYVGLDRFPAAWREYVVNGVAITDNGQPI